MLPQQMKMMRSRRWFVFPVSSGDVARDARSMDSDMTD